MAQEKIKTENIRTPLLFAFIRSINVPVARYKAIGV